MTEVQKEIIELVKNRGRLTRRLKSFEKVLNDFEEDPDADFENFPASRQFQDLLMVRSICRTQAAP